MATRAGVTMSSTVDIGDIARRLNDAERRVFVRWERKILDRIKRKWRNWEYKGRPDGAPVNVSLSTWTSRVQTTTGAVLTVENLIGYAGYVHRAGLPSIAAGGKGVVGELVDEINANDVPKMTADLRAEVLRNIATPRRRRQVAGGRSPATEDTTIRIEA